MKLYLKFPFVNKLLFFTFLALCFQNVSIGPLKIYHLFLLFFIFLPFERYVFSKKDLFPILFFFLTILQVLILYLYSGFPNLIFLNFLFCLVFYLSSKSFFNQEYQKEIIKPLQLGSIVIISISLFNLISSFDEVLKASIAGGVSGVRPNVSRLVFAGGINLEATWIVILSSFFIKHKRWFIYYSIPCLLIVSAYQSRTAILLYLFSLCFYCFYQGYYKSLRKLSFIIFTLLAIILIFHDKIISSTVASRFLNIGNEPGSQGRLEMWGYLYDSFMQAPIFGNGLGSAIVSIKKMGFVGNEDNIHNVYLQFLIEGGLLGFLLFFGVVITVLFKCHNTELKVFLILYFIGCFTQFRGVEAITFFIMGLSFNSYSQDPKTSGDKL